MRFLPTSEASRNMGDFTECLTLGRNPGSLQAVHLLDQQPKYGGQTAPKRSAFPGKPPNHIDAPNAAGFGGIASFPGPCCVRRDPAEPCPAALNKVLKQFFDR